MNRFFFIAVLMLLSLAATSGASAQGQPVSQPASATPGAKAEDSARKPSEGVTREQAAAILVELRAIRQLLAFQDQRLAALSLGTDRVPAPPASEKVSLSLASAEQRYSLGAEDAPVTLVEFGDFQCPFCKKFHATAFADLKKDYIDTGKVRFISRDLPLEFHPFAMKAAEAARCAGDQSKYWELRDALYTSQEALNDGVITKAVERLPLEVKAFQSCLVSHKYKADAQKDANEAATLQINGTPTFVLAKSAKDKLDGIRIVGAQSFAAFQSAIDALLNNSPQDSARGGAEQNRLPLRPQGGLEMGQQKSYIPRGVWHLHSESIEP